MAKYTKYLFYFSLSLSAVSYFTIKKFGYEIYPFTTWKLFSLPSGSSSKALSYRLYTTKHNDTSALAYYDAGIFNAVEQHHVVDKYGALLDSGIAVKESRQKIYQLAKIMAPKADSFLLVKEIFNPQNIYTDSFVVIKKTIARLP